MSTRSIASTSRLGDRRHLAVERPDPFPDRRVGQDPHPVELEADGRVSEPVDRLVHRAEYAGARPAWPRAAPARQAGAPALHAAASRSPSRGARGTIRAWPPPPFPTVSTSPATRRPIGCSSASHWPCSSASRSTSRSPSRRRSADRSSSSAGSAYLDAAKIAALDPATLDEVFRRRPALHRFPGSMATKVQALCAADRPRLRQRCRPDLDRGQGRQGPRAPTARPARLRRR